MVTTGSGRSGYSWRILTNYSFFAGYLRLGGIKPAIWCLDKLGIQMDTTSTL